MKPIAIFDTECYNGYYLAAFLDIETGKVKCVEQREGVAFDRMAVLKILKRYTVVGFNSKEYDLPLMAAAVMGGHDLKKLSDAIIRFNLQPWEFYDKYNLPELPADSIDLIEVAPGIASLKLYGARLHSKTLWDLPYKTDEILTPEQMDEVREYCINDLQTTYDLYKKLKPQLDLREQMSIKYNIDLRSKSDAQIAEAVIGHELRAAGVFVKRPTLNEGYNFKYEAPGYLKGQLNGLVDEIEGLTFKLSDKGSAVLPEELAGRDVTIGSTTYRMGIGGLHSREKALAIKSNKLSSIDVASYYPTMIIKNKYYPEHLGKDFLQVYTTLYLERLKAKRNGNKVEADVKKILLNGTFGKLGSKWSIFYSPKMLIQITLTGQLNLLMLINSFETNGIKVHSANTDGLVVEAEDEDLKKELIKQWEVMTGMTMEDDPVKALFARDVNTYVMVMGDKAKTKGYFALDNLAKNPHADIVIKAVVKYLTDGIPVEKTIRSCTDIRDFIICRTAKEGAMYQGKPLGRVVRWYYGKGLTDAILTAERSAKVSESEGGKPIMTLPDVFPDDVDYDKYISIGYDDLKLIGVKND